MTEIINLTGKTIKIDVGDVYCIIDPCKENHKARIKSFSKPSKIESNTSGLGFPEIQINEVKIHKVILPEQKEGVFYIVNAIVFNASKRDDLLIVSETKRSYDKNTIYCRSLSRVVYDNDNAIKEKLNNFVNKISVHTKKETESHKLITDILVDLRVYVNNI